MNPESHAIRTVLLPVLHIAHSLSLVVASIAFLSMPLHGEESDAPSPIQNEPGPTEETDLAKQLANPISSLISVPFQSNWDFGIGLNDASRYFLNFQPVVPMSINEEWNLISRTILPVIEAESPSPGIPDVSGFGDTVQSFFLSPKDPVNGWILGAGPVFLMPTASSHLLGAQHWGAGPTGVALKQEGPWTFGALFNHLWSFRDDGTGNEVNSTFLQPFVAYVTPKQTTYSLNLESSYNWEASGWTIPVNAVVSQLFVVGSQPIQAFVGGRYYAEAPSGGPEWGVRAGLVLLFPK